MVMKRWLLALIAGRFGLLPTVAALADNPASPPADTHAAEGPALEVLRSPIEDIRWDDAPFEEVIEWLRGQGRINVLVRWAALMDEGVNESSLVSLHLSDATVADVLREALAQVAYNDAAGFVALGNTIRISSRRELNADMIVRVYDIGDLIVDAPDFRGPVVRVDQVGGSSGDTAPILEGSDPGNDPTERTPASAMEDRPGVAKAREIIEHTVEPQSWWAGGGKGTIRGFDRALVVRNSIEVHEMIAGRFVQR